MIRAMTAKRRHTQLMRLAATLVHREMSDALWAETYGRKPPAPASRADLVALAFGRLAVRLDDDEAAAYLAAARIDAGGVR